MSSVPGQDVSGNSFQKARPPPTQRLRVREPSENSKEEVRSLLDTFSRRVVEIDRLEQIKFQDACRRTIRHMLKQYNDKIKSTYKKRITGLEKRLKSQTDTYIRKMKEARIMILKCIREIVRKRLDEKEKEKKVTELEQKITELKLKIEEMENEARSRNSSFLEEIYEKDTQIEALSYIKEERDRLSTFIDEINTDMNEILVLWDDEEHKKKLALKNATKELTEKIIEIEKDRDCKIASLKNEIQEQRRVLSDRDRQITALKTEIEQLKENNTPK